MVEDFGGGVILQYLSASIFMLAGTLFFIFLTKTVSTVAVGNISLLLAILQFLSILFSLGMKGAMEHFLSYYIGRGEPGAVKSFLVRYSLFSGILSLMAFALTFSLSPYLSLLFYHSTDYTPLIRLLSIDTGLSMLFTVMMGAATGLQHFRRGAVIYMAGSISVYGMATLFLIMFGTVHWVIIGWITGYAVGITLFSIHITRFSKGILATRTGWGVKGVLAYSIPLFASSLLFFGATYVDRLIVAVFLNLSLLGIYNLALLVAQGIAFLVNPLNNILLPKFSEMFSRYELEGIRGGVRFSINLVTLLYSPVSLGVAALSPSILILIGNENYLPGALPLTILVIVSGVFISQYVLVQALSGTRRTGIFLLATGASFLVNLMASFILIPEFGIVGAAISNSMAPVASFAIIWVSAARLKVASFDLGTMVRIWISSLLMAVMVYTFQSLEGYGDITFLEGVVIGIASYVVLIKATGSLKREIAEQLVGIFGKRMRGVSRLFIMLSSDR